MKNIVLLLILSFSLNVFAQRKISRDLTDQPLSLGITHMLPSALVIPAGVVILGTTSGAGFFDVLDVTTNLYLDLQQVFNISTKVNLYNSDPIAIGIYASYVTQTVKKYDTSSGFANGQTSSSASAVSPGLVFSYRMRRHLTGHVGSSFVFRTPPAERSTLTQRSSLVQGHTLYKEFAYGVNPTVAVAAGGSYDLTYDIWGAGLTVHVGNFQIGAHYYFPNVTEGTVIPIVGGGYSARLD